MKSFLGVDVGSVSVKMALLDSNRTLRGSVYLETAGSPINAIKDALSKLEQAIEKDNLSINGIGITGSGRHVAVALLGADIVKNEVTAQTIAALNRQPDVSTIIEIGGQDSKIISIKDGVPLWHNLNTLCAAGTGSFLNSQAHRLDIPIESFGDYALRSDKNLSISAKCTVFAESDMIHKAALGHKKEDIIYGLCRGLVRNFISNVSKNRVLEPPTLFTGGTAANKGVVKAFEEELKHKIIVPEEHKIMGSIGMALLLLRNQPENTAFKGFGIAKEDITTETQSCGDCSNNCEITKVFIGNRLSGYLNSRCGKFSA